MAKIGDLKIVKGTKHAYLKAESSKGAQKLHALIGKIPLLKKFNNLSLKKRRTAAGAIFLIIVLLAAYVIHDSFFTVTEEAEYTEYTVSKNDITVAISGTGTAEPLEQYDIVSTVTGDVLSDSFEEGDLVSEGAVLYNIDSSEMEKTLEKADISLEKSQMEYEDAVSQYSGATITAPVTGQISEILVEKGDNVSSGSQVAKIVNNSTLTATVAFVSADTDNLYVGQSATLTLSNSFETLTGKISKIYNSKRIVDGSISVTDVEVRVTNPGALDEGTSVTVAAGGVSSYESGELEYESEQFITASASGTVAKITAPEGTYVKKGASVLTLSGDSESDSLASSQLDLRTAQLSYQSTQEELDDYSIESPISGSIISKTVKAGDTIDNADGNTVLAVVADMSKMTFDISVDELDIASLEEGQTVNITADALEDQTFTGYVSNIALLGTTENGVTTYPVTIMIDEPGDLWPGMNLTADIVVESATDVLAIPVGAVNRGNLVLVKGTAPETTETSSGSAMSAPSEGQQAGNQQSADRNASQVIDQSTAPDGYYYVKVSIGINDDTYIEITDGLSEGDVILVPVTTTKTTETTSEEEQMPGMMPSGGGGGGDMGGPPAGM